MKFSAFVIAHMVFSKLVLYEQPPIRMIVVYFVTVSAWMLYSFMMISLFSVGMMFYFLFKDTRKFGIHLWSWFM